MNENIKYFCFLYLFRKILGFGYVIMLNDKFEIVEFDIIEISLLVDDDEWLVVVEFWDNVEVDEDFWGIGIDDKILDIFLLSKESIVFVLSIVVGGK